jgi:CheY-like chemotaxis protein
MNLDAKVGHYIMLTVSDTGTGIPSEILDRIFEPFFTTKEIGAGTGLGLSTVRGIIKSHGGFIHVTSEVDRGSKFKIFLPSVETHPELSLDNSEILTGHGELILVVDDETAICEVTTAILTDNNYQTLVAHNGIEAIAIYAKHSEQINTVLMDIIMPEMDGITAIRTMKIMNPQVQIIACSGLDAKHILNKHPTVEAAAILFKPYTAKELLQKLAPIVQGKR